MNGISETEAYFCREDDERGAASCREEESRGRGINTENSDKEVIISTQSIFYPVGLLGGLR